ncbi:PKD domain-containing protein [Hyphobacterium sp. CCMP332]|nr:PKD domain-containing protein [Hyphobacterium sp. CCMP332]
MAQCPDVLGSFGTVITPSQNPVWIGCGSGPFTVNFQMTGDITGAFTIDWGDGNSSSGNGLLSTAFISHTYAATVDTFNVTFSNACGTISGLVVMEEAVIASVKTGFGGVTKSCAPATLFFTNQSVHNSPNTTYTWDWGDGSPIEFYGPANHGDTLAHTYLKGTVDCETEVTLTAENFCTAGNPSQNILRPIQIWDIDSAIINASQTLLCYPDTVVTFTNVSDLNCATPALGNTKQRYEQWTFFDLYGPGQDSVIGWGPFPVSIPRTIAFPGPGTYTIQLLDSNQCGIATEIMQIVITSPPSANFSSPDTVCQGDLINFTNLSGNGANAFQWNFGDGNFSTNTNPTYSYDTSGLQTVSLSSSIAGGSASCLDVFTKNIFVLKAPDASLLLSDDRGCDSLSVNFQDNSSPDVSIWNWNFGNGQNSNAQNPGTIFFDSIGSYEITLQVQSAKGCIDLTSDTVDVFMSPIVNISPNAVCQGINTQFIDQSIYSLGDSILSWNWDFGDGTNSALQNPNHIYLNADTFDIVLSINTNECTGIDTVSIIVEPVPQSIFTLDSIEACSPYLFTTNNQSDSMGTPSLQYFWYVDNTVYSGSKDTLILLQNNAVQDSIYSISLIAETTFGCKDSSAIDVTLFPEVMASFTHTSIDLCNPDSIQFNTILSGNVNNVFWDFGDGSTSNVFNPSHLFTNDSLTILEFPVLLSASSSKGCVDSHRDTISIGPNPYFDFTFSPSISCSPLNATFSAEPGAVSYNWDFGNGQPGIGQFTQMTYTSTVDTAFNVTLRTLNAFGCRDTIQKSLTVLGGAKADFNSSVNTSVCAPVQVEFYDSSVNAQNLYWDFGDGTQGTGNQVNHTYNNDSSFTLVFPVQLIAESSSGCRDTLVKDVLIKPELKLSFNFTPDSFCGPQMVAFNAIGVASAYSWDFGDGSNSVGQNTSHTYLSNADSSYLIRLTGLSSFNCRDTVYDTLNSKLQANAQIGPLVIPAGCSPALSTFQNLSSDGDEFYWDFGDGSSILNSSDTIVNHIFVNNGSQNQTFTIELIASKLNGCSDTALKNIVVYPKVDVAISALQDSICSGSLAQFIVDNNISNADIYNWDFGNNSFGTGFTGNSSYISSVDSIFQIVLQGQSFQGCTDSDTVDLLVIRQPNANFNTVYPNPACTPLNVSFNSSSDSSFNYIWDLDNGTVINNQFNGIQTTYINTDSMPKIFLPILILSPGGMCADTFIQSISVNPVTSYDFVGTPLNGCSPLSVDFNAESGAILYEWNFGNGNNGIGQNTNQVFTTNLDTSFNVRLISTNTYQCKDTTVKTIDIYPSANAHFTTVNTPICTPATINFFNLSDTSKAISYKWDFGDGNINISSASNVSNTYVNTTGNPVNYLVELIAFANYGCNDTATKTITILPQPNINIGVDTIEGCSPLEIEFTALGNASNYFWEFENGNSDAGVLSRQVFVNDSDNDSIFSARLIGQSSEGCADTIYSDINVLVKPIAQFSVDNPIKNLPDKTFQLFQESQKANEFYWNFGDGSPQIPGNPVDYTYQEHGQYLITMIAQNRSCFDSAEVIVLIKPVAPIPDFDAYGVGCAPLKVDFQNFSDYAKSYEWDFGDGIKSNAENPVHTYVSPGIYQVKLTAMNELDSISVEYDSIAVVFENPEARFSLSKPGDSVIFIPRKTIAFRNYSKGAINYLWDFGDGSISIVENPEKEYNQLGEYLISLIAENEFQCKDTAFLSIRAKEGGAASIPNAFTPNPNFSNGGQINSSGVNDVFFPVTDGATGMHMQIFNRWGELIFESKRLDIGWDGYYRGKLCKQDVYVYRIALDFIDGQKRVEIGDVTLLR